MPVEKSDYLFSPSLLSEIDFSSVEHQYQPPIDFLNPGEGLKLRPLRLSDYDSGVLECLKQLTAVGNVSKNQYEETFRKMKDQGMYYIIVVEDTGSGKVVASGTLFLEQKFIHDCALRGRIEDVVVDSSQRGRQIGKLLIHTLTLMSKHLECYKVTLDCNDSNRNFYEKLGFKREEGNSNFMQIRY